jgi:hypothetical protein
MMFCFYLWYFDKNLVLHVDNEQFILLIHIGKKFITPYKLIG